MRTRNGFAACQSFWFCTPSCLQRWRGATPQRGQFGRGIAPRRNFIWYYLGGHGGE